MTFVPLVLCFRGNSASGREKEQPRSRVCQGRRPDSVQGKASVSEAETFVLRAGPLSMESPSWLGRTGHISDRLKEKEEERGSFERERR